MKKVLVAVLVVAVTLIGASAAMAKIGNSKHDLSFGNTQANVIKESTAGLSSCQFCHTPHNSNTAMTVAPLWNKTANSSYSAYNSNGTGGTLAGTAVGAPGQHSLTCLSCHDGVSSVGVTYANGTRTMADQAGRSSGGVLSAGNLANLSTDLRNDHPVGFDIVDDGRAGIDTLANMKNKGFTFYIDGTRTNSMECATCHDPHGFDKSTGNANAPFLRSAKATLCSDCHVNK